MVRSFSGVAVSISALLVSAPASGAVFVFASQLSPEVAGATGSGFAQVTFDTVAQTLLVETSWSGLSAPTTVAHIHCCIASPGTVGVAVTPNTFPGFPAGLTSGSYTSPLLDLTQSTTYTTGFVTGFGGGTIPGAQGALLTGLQARTAYLNIHTSAFPGGEIRGFLTSVPEPATWATMIVGFGLLGGVMRKARQRQIVTYQFT